MNTELDVDGAVLILNGATSVGAGSSGSMPAGGIVIVEAYGTTSSGTGSAIIQIQVSNNGTTWQTAGTINLNLKNTRTSDTFTMDDSWSSWTYLRANLASISGTGASVYVYKNAGLSQGLAAELAALGVPVPIWKCGLPFVLFGGDGGANGLLMGVTGAFTLSAPVLDSGVIMPFGYAYLPANAGGLGNAAGFFYFTMSTATAGIFYNNTYSPATEIPPTIPSVLVPFTNGSGSRITQTLDEITCTQITLADDVLGPNGRIVHSLKYCTGPANVSRIYMRAGGNQWYQNSATGASNQMGDVTLQMAGSLQQQASTRAFKVNGELAASSSGDFSSIDMSVNRTLTAGLKLSSTFANIAMWLQVITVAKGA